MNPLQTRKQALIAQSDLNRDQMIQELTLVRAGIHSLGARDRSLGTIFSSAAGLVAGIVNYRRSDPAAAPSKPSLLQSVLRGTGLACTLWMAYRAKNADRP